MAIIVNLDVMMAKRKISSGDLAEKVGITPANLSILKNQKAKAVRFSTLNDICKALEYLEDHIRNAAYKGDNLDPGTVGRKPLQGFFEEKYIHNAKIMIKFS